jgi:UDP-glucuronate decarboxylase
MKDGHEVWGIDNFVSSPRQNVENIKKFGDFHFVEGDICTFDYAKLPDDMDWIFNLACPASPPKYQRDPLFTIRTNTVGVFNVLELALKCNATVIQASTSEIYGDPLEHPQNEEYRGNVVTVGPRSCYDEGKRIAEGICYEYRCKKNLNAKISRIFNTYGPYMDRDDGRVITNFVDAALGGRPLPVYGTGEQTRSVQYVDDLMEGFLKLVTAPFDVWGPFNLGNPREFTINEIADTVIKVTKSKSKKEYFPLPKDDPTKRRPDISRAKKMLGWEPKVSFEEGLARYIEWYKEYYQ